MVKKRKPLLRYPLTYKKGMETFRGQLQHSSPEELENIWQYIFAGKALFTIRNPRTGKRFTFRIVEKKIEVSRAGKSGFKSLFFVSVLVGPDNTRTYSYLGTIFENGKFQITGKTKIVKDSPSMIAWQWVYRNLYYRMLPDFVEFWHEGRCGKCGRTLTDPSSINTGYGPECYKRMFGKEREELKPKPV